MPGGPSTWTTDEVLVWLKLAKCEALCTRFRAHGITGAALLVLGGKKGALTVLTEGLPQSKELAPRLTAAVAELRRVAACVEAGNDPFEEHQGSAVAQATSGAAGSAAAAMVAESDDDDEGEGREAVKDEIGDCSVGGWNSDLWRLIVLLIQYLGMLWIYFSLSGWWNAREPVLGPKQLKNDAFNDVRKGGPGGH